MLVKPAETPLRARRAPCPVTRVACRGRQPFQPKLHITNADFLSITRNGQLCDAEGGLGLEEFELVMRDQAMHARARARNLRGV